MNTSYFVACDLGAESGRVMLGTLSDGVLKLEEVHRFPNLPVRLGDSLRWDILGTFRELKTGLKKVGSMGLPVTSLSVDSWGVDYVWIGAGQPMLAPPYVYRDERVDAAFEVATARVSKEIIFEATGLQFLAFNTLYQLCSDMEHSPAMVGIAEQFLCIADYFNFLFSGVGRLEQSMASTTQVYDPRTRDWSASLIEAFDLPVRVFPEIVPSGTTLGGITPAIALETGLAPTVNVVATCSHDTGAAVAAVPASGGDDWAYLSSGTWSLIGVELPEPLICTDVYAADFTNEGGFGGTTRFLKNVVGLWILQECRRTWVAEGHEFDYATLTALASDAAPLVSLINPADSRFVKPGDMPAKIEAFCRESGQLVPATTGAYVRCILESLALMYRRQLALIESLTGRTIRKLHIVGGGSQSNLLNQFSANATGRMVIAGPVEGTAIGNILIQAIASGHLDSLGALRECVARSFPVDEFSPEEADLWSDAFKRFESLC
ncbi:MAG: rhamnulokinase [Chthoniobacterales bacterium]